MIRHDAAKSVHCSVYPVNDKLALTLDQYVGVLSINTFHYRYHTIVHLVNSFFIHCFPHIHIIL